MSTAAIAVRERGLLMSGPMVRATLDGRKTMTRRVATKQNAEIGTGLPWDQLDWSRVHVDPGFGDGSYLKVGGPDDTLHRVRCRWSVGDRLWVRESYRLFDSLDKYPASKIPRGRLGRIWHEADGPPTKRAGRLRDARFMPRSFSRLTLEITDVRVERLQDISCEDVQAEGVTTPDAARWLLSPENMAPWRLAFRELWNGLNAKRGFSFESNPHVWVLSFRRVDA